LSVFHDSFFKARKWFRPHFVEPIPGPYMPIAAWRDAADRHAHRTRHIGLSLGDITPLAARLRDALVAEAGLFAVALNVSLGISWTGQFADQSHDNAVKGNFSWRF